METTLLAALGLYAVLLLIVTRGVIVDPGLGGFQKTAQVLIVWFIPVMGMAVVVLMQGHNHTREEMKRLLPFPLYLAAPSAAAGNASLASPPNDGYDNHCGADVADGD